METGQTLYWDYYQYVIENPIMKWDTPTSILYGKKDELCEYNALLSFCAKAFIVIFPFQIFQSIIFTRKQIWLLIESGFGNQYAEKIHRL